MLDRYLQEERCSAHRDLAVRTPEVALSLGVHLASQNAGDPGMDMQLTAHRNGTQKVGFKSGSDDRIPKQPIQRSENFVKGRTE